MAALDVTNILGNDLELIRVTEDLYDEAIKFYQNNFLVDEPVCKALNFQNCELSKKESGIVLKTYLEDGISFAIRHYSSKEIVALRVNSMLPRPSNATSDFQPQAAGTLADIEFVERVKSSYDLFKEWNLNCAMEFNFLATSSDFIRRGLGMFLSKYSLNFARQMAEGTLKDINDLPAHVRVMKPQAVCCIYSSYYSQKLAEKLGMQILTKIPYTEFHFNGKSLAEKIDPIHQFVVYTAIRL